MPPFFEGSNPQPPFVDQLKKGPKWDPSFKSYWRRAGDSNPRCPFGAYSLSRRAPSASRSALRNSRSIVTKQSKLSKREFSNCLATFPPCSFRPYPSERLREPSSSLPMVRHIWKMQTARQEKEAVVDQLNSGICQLIRHDGHWRQLESSLADGLDRFLERRRLADAHLVHKALHFFQRAAARLLAARHQTVTSQRQARADRNSNRQTPER